MSTSTASERRRRRSAGPLAAPAVAGIVGPGTATEPRPCVWYVGLRWLTHRASGTLPGFPKDAATVAEAVRAQLRG